MKYEKPELVRIASALEAVQNLSDKTQTTAFDGSHDCSATAYAADE
jgi:hypothetical protein